MSVRPPFDEAAARAALRAHFDVGGDLRELPSYRDRNFHVVASDGAEYVLKIASAEEPRESIEFQNAALDHLTQHHTPTGAGMCWPRTHRTRDGASIAAVASADGATFLTRLLDWIPGTPLAEALPHDRHLLFDLGRFVGGMDRALATFDHPAANREFHWDLQQGRTIVERNVGLVDAAADRALIQRHLERFERDTAPLLAGLPRGVIHNDANDYNVLVTIDTTTGVRRTAAIIDLGDMVHTWVIGDLAIALAYAMMDKADPLGAAAAVVAGYAVERPPRDDEIAVLHDLVCLRLAVSVTTAARQIRREPDNAYLGISERPAWDLLRRLDALPPALAHHTYRDAGGLPAHPASSAVGDGCAPLDAAAIHATRRAHVGPSLSLSYDRPLTIVRGWMQYLFEADGQRYLDCVNNVCHVGHCHPRVVEAARAQQATLNTNTRYLHPLLAAYAERLTALFPAPLSVCYLANSGSEANDLALRLARTHTARHGVLVVDGAYHGNLSSLVDISPYKFAGPGGAGPPPWVRVVPMPDPYRGRYRGDGADLGARYAQHVAEAADTIDGGPAAFICESLLGCGGQVALPDGYLREAFDHVRAAGGLAIADEVQVGFGRIGTHRWGFETQDVVPDIVTLGKPIGNGHPLAAVITTPEIAASFDNGMEYFNTFGGNPVSCAVGLAVLDAIEEDGLQEHARTTGAHLEAGLRALAERYPAIGDVRGMGLFLGVELVRDRTSREPDAALADAVVQQARQAGVLLSTDGPDHNVIKIKPPLPFDEKDADLLVATLDTTLTDTD